MRKKFERNDYVKVIQPQVPFNPNVRINNNEIDYDLLLMNDVGIVTDSCHSNKASPLTEVYIPRLRFKNAYYADRFVKIDEHEYALLVLGQQ